MNYVSRESKEYIFFENFFSLSVLQFASNALPMITIPFLTRALGLEVFGKYVFILALINFLDIVVSYGFRVSATDQIAKNTSQKTQQSHVFHSLGPSESHCSHQQSTFLQAKWHASGLSERIVQSWS